MAAVATDFAAAAEAVVGHRTRVVVVGGGPAGLLSAVTAAQAGCDVLVLEQRMEYVRNVWFDITGKQLNSPSQELLSR
jgi:2-polyprenyl-6-methoxyphenol hydroxylase-like FAD-dependent oxidoreductase